MTQPNMRIGDVFKLEYPQSVGIFQTYEDAQKVVDHLSEKQFPVQNLCIVGTELKSVERVTGRQTWGTVLRRGIQSGLSTGLMVGLIMLLFVQDNVAVLLIGALGIGILIGLMMSVLSYLAERGRRDFTSVSQIMATRYELLCEHKFASQAREAISEMPEARRLAFAAVPQQWGYQYPQQQAYPNQAPNPAQPYPAQAYPAAQYQPPPQPMPNPSAQPPQEQPPVQPPQDTPPQDGSGQG
jgi:hypothetical protein